jgi:hypothetical protein
MPQSVEMLGYNGKVKYSISGNKFTIKLPVITSATNPCQYAWVLRVKGSLKQQVFEKMNFTKFFE